MGTISTDPKLNPYRPPPPSTFGEFDLSAPTEVAFQLTPQLRRHAEAQFLLHWRPKMMLFSSLAMIAGSCAILIFAMVLMPASILPTMVCVLAISAAIYSAMVHETKKRLRSRQQAHGLSGNEMLTLQSDSERTTLVSSGQIYRWPNHQLKIYPTRRGLLICPEPLLFVFIPKKSSFQVDSYRRFVKVIESRAAARPA